MLQLETRMMAAITSPRKQKKNKAQSDYSSFDQLDGWHPWQDSVKESFILYPVRKLKQGKVAWFNFTLAKEMGLLPKDADEVLTKSLENKLLDTFCLRIVNEYDQENNIKYHPRMLKENEYMATRYLQLQHDDKTGKTSGDGRSIWNGVVSHRGKTWDVSSRGTGVTALAPGAVISETPLESGNTDQGYGCGLAEIDEMYASAMMAEIMHMNGVNTERMLVIIDIGDECAIGVRAGDNLIRPAHLFMHLKQENYDELQAATDFLINRQYKNKEWSFDSRSKDRYNLLLDEMAKSFGKFAAQLEREYIFAWLDWDGDNVLATAGIIDYGSVRQFGVRHDQYRYDDVERFSTNLNEQKSKAKLTVQVFAQMVDYLETKKRKPLSKFKKHRSMKLFEKHFEDFLLEHFLYQIGFTEVQGRQLLRWHRKFVSGFFKEFQALEKRKTKRKLHRVADGVNRPALLNMRQFLFDFPELLLESESLENVSLMKAKEFLHEFGTDFASRNDLKPSEPLKTQIRKIQKKYLNCLKKVSGSEWSKSAKQLKKRAQIINASNRVTGNALINMVNEILVRRRQGLSDQQIMETMTEFVKTQTRSPEAANPKEQKQIEKSLNKHPLGKAFLSLVEDYKEDI